MHADMSSQPKTPLAIRAKRVLARLKNVRGQSEDEKALHALGIAATPEDRWGLVQAHIRKFGPARITRRTAYSVANQLG